MKYALNLANDGRVLSVTYSEYAPEDAVKVNNFPDGDIADYKYVNNEFIHDPLPTPEENIKPSQLDRIEAQVMYNSMMLGTLTDMEGVE